ncbi:lactate dehydrogenase-like 2-hydroxyacid dehydrogenase [Humitalea rosea]|uniref:Lactate dehydrogenase-like 2-hydroxyacid dehydrogenase n=1 Tax=Humitalea rosea TaxID=990373 RepID=A0A2W7HZD7_9PROT|nr:D-glycerate dehydrogenase [Humitalea rosea]PZW40051.1 lactate dehydrogenase-like 2-hydroxyacid dehydrogenase [Humitalea rosea]
MKHKLVCVRRLPPNVAARVRSEFDAVLDDARDPTLPEALALMAEHKADALLFSSGFRLTAETIAALPPSVKVAATASVGFDHVDLAAARARGLVVTNTPEVLTGCTADMAFTLLLAAARRLGENERLMRNDAWVPRGMGDGLGVRVWGKTLGIVGMGRIGRAMARRARGFDMNVIYTDLTRIAGEEALFVPTLAEMLPLCDFLTLHVPLTPQTTNMIDAAALALLPPRAVVVNASRGGVVDEAALMAALASGKVFAAGLDVFATEPRFDARWIDVPNAILTPHTASGTIETRDAMGFRALDNIAAVLAGQPAIDPLWS